MSDTPNLNLPYMLAAQAQKHVTHNEALRMLDAVVQLSVLDRNLAAPPTSPANGDRYIVAASPTGAWSGQAEKIAAFQDGAWAFYAPKEGWVAWIADENAVAAFDGASWMLISGGGGGGVTDHGALTGLSDDDHPQYHNNARGDARYAPIVPSMLGINATADATNRLAVASAASLFNHVGNGHQVKVNKSAAADTASFLFQTGFSGRAEFGTTGDDDWHVKVSNNGSTWFEALRADRASGAMRFPSGVQHLATLKPAFMLIQASPIRDIWWGGMDTTASTPRTYTISSVAGANVTLTADMVPEILHTGLHDVVLIRVWNTSKTPAQAAWVKYQVSVNTFTVSNAAHISGWLTGETLRLGDPNPTGSNVLSMIAIDISPYMQAHLGAVFPQKGLKVAIAPQGVGGRAQIDISGNGASGSAFGPSSQSDGSRQQAMFDAFTDQLSPVSNSNLFFVRETLISGTALANTRLVRLAGIYV